MADPEVCLRRCIEPRPCSLFPPPLMLLRGSFDAQTPLGRFGRRGGRILAVNLAILISIIDTMSNIQFAQENELALRIKLFLGTLLKRAGAASETDRLT